MWSFCGIEFDSKPDVRPVRGVPGLYLARHIVSDLEEAALLESISAEPVPWVQRRSRYTKNYGPYYVYRSSAKQPTAIRSTKLPTWATGFLEARLKHIFSREIPDNWTVNQVHVALYRASKKNKISPHNDTSMGTLMNAVVGVSLGDVATMTFEDGKLRKEVKLPRRSAYLMTDDALTVWKHSIRASHNTGNRLSITCRNVISLAAPTATKPTIQNALSQQTVTTVTTATATTTAGRASLPRQSPMPTQPPPVYTEDVDTDNSFYPSGDLPPATTPTKRKKKKDKDADDDAEVDLRDIVKVWGVSEDKVRKLRRFHNM